jgi:rod shape-determining protein MreD
MKPGVLYYVDTGFRAVTPVVLAFLMLVISRLPFGIEGLETAMPLLTLIACYYWTIYRPNLMPSIALFFLGVLQDLVTGGPLGLMALVLLLVHWLVDAQRRVFLGKSFVVGWWGFGLIALGAEVVIWVLASIYYDQLLVVRPFAFQFMLTVAIYPCFAWLFSLVQRAIVK